MVADPSDEAATAQFEHERGYFEQYQRDWTRPSQDLVTELASWFEALLEPAPLSLACVAGNGVLHTGETDAKVCIGGFVVDGTAVPPECASTRSTPSARSLSRRRGPHGRLGEISLLLSCRFTAHRQGAFNAFVLTYFKALFSNAWCTSRAVTERRAISPTDRTLVSPSPGRPLALRRDLRRLVHVQPPSLAVQSRGGSSPHER
jgi:hypothetical protein